MVAFVGTARCGLVFKERENKQIKKRKRKTTPHTMNTGKLAFLGQFVSLSYYTSVRSHRKQHVHWSRLGKQFVSPTSQTFTLHIYIFFTWWPVETVLMMAFLSDQSHVWAAGSMQLDITFILIFPFEND